MQEIKGGRNNLKWNIAKTDIQSHSFVNKTKRHSTAIYRCRLNSLF